MNNQYYPDNLFSATPPLAERMRPKNLDQFIGQQVITGKTSLLRKALDAGVVPSLILWGPPGTGKTTLVYIIANHTKLPLITLNAVESGVRQVREAIDKAAGQGKTLLFIDEIHRFNKAQQDALLSAVEKGITTLIGATTENPSFEVIAPLLSRCSVFVLETLNADELLRIVQFAIHNDEYLRSRNIELVEYEALLKLSGGDARKLLNLLEFLVQSQPPTNEPLRITNQLTDELGKQLLLRYDKSGEQHYDIISAFIKSLRGSDPNAAIY